MVIRYYDNGGRSFDRYTAVFPEAIGGYYYYLAMSAHPQHPQGFCSADCSACPIDAPLGRVPRMGSTTNLGQRVGILDLPPEVRRALAAFLAE